MLTFSFALRIRHQPIGSGRLLCLWPASANGCRNVIVVSVVRMQPYSTRLRTLLWLLK